MMLFATFLPLLSLTTTIFAKDVARFEPPGRNYSPLEGETIFSQHIPKHLPSLGLSTGELKQFAGHSLQLIKSKCPAVPKENLNQVNKYISKLILKAGPSPGQTVGFKQLISSISECSQDVRQTQAVDKDYYSRYGFLHSLLSPFSGLFSGRNMDNPEETEEGSSPTTPSTDSNANAEVVSSKPEKTSQVVTPSTSEKPVDPTPVSERGFVVHTFVINDGEPVTTTVHSSHSNIGSWGPLGWFSQMFSMINGFFARLFGFGGDDLSSTSPRYRVKRAVATEPRETESADAMQVKSDAEDDIGDMKEERSIRMKGKDAFLILVDNMCRIYCDDCVEPNQILAFKSAAKELLQLLFADSTGIELASKHYLDPNFLQTLNDC